MRVLNGEGVVVATGVFLISPARGYDKVASSGRKDRDVLALAGHKIVLARTDTVLVLNRRESGVIRFVREIPSIHEIIVRYEVILASDVLERSVRDRVVGGYSPRV